MQEKETDHETRSRNSLRRNVGCWNRAETITDLFTSTGDDLFNVTRYFRENTHGTLDLTGSQLFGPFLVPGTKAGPLSGHAAREAAMDAARKAARTNGSPNVAALAGRPKLTELPVRPSTSGDRLRKDYDLPAMEEGI